jgi:hypothetical protein
VRAARLERRPQRGALAEEVLLADELTERLRPHPRGQRAVGRRPMVGALLGWVEESVH